MKGLVNKQQTTPGRELTRKGQNMNKQTVNAKPPSGGLVNWIEKHPWKFLSIVTTVVLVAYGATYIYVKLKGGAV